MIKLNTNEQPLIIDLFAGGGGASVGIEMALGRQVDIAVNHDPEAIRMHRTNHPHTLHLTEDVFKVDLEKYIKGKQVALMWASPDCFPAGNLVLTDKGYKPIEEVECFDKVLTHTGEYRTVTRTIKKNDCKFVNLKISGAEEFQATLNHPFYVRKKYVKTIHGAKRSSKVTMLSPEWVNAENLSTKYRVGIPVNDRSVVPVWNGCVYETHNQYGRTLLEIKNTLGALMDNADFWWIIGRYIGDGSLSMQKGTVDICCAFDQQDEIRKHMDAIHVNYTERDKSTTHSFLISSREWVEFLKQFGIGSVEKAITPTIMDLPVSLLKSFAEGYLSADGCREEVDGNTRIRLSTVSKKLAYGMQHVVLKAFGRYCSMVCSKNQTDVIEGGTVNVHPLYSLSFCERETDRLQYEVENGIAWVNVKKAEVVNDTQKSIYTLSVDTDESYTVNNFAVHNCTSHSKAKGGQPRKSGLRVLPWAVYKHARAIKPDVIVMENVEEIQLWGPLDQNGFPIRERMGESYRAFIRAMQGLGYDYDTRELVAADYGAPTTRKRWYAIFRRDGKAIIWPRQTHSRNGAVPGTKSWEPVWKYLDLDDYGKSIFGREKPLADKTMGRIAAGVDKFVLKNPEPFIVVVNHGWDSFRGQSLHEPLSTITAKHGFGIVTPVTERIGIPGTNDLMAAFLTKFYKSGTGQSMFEPIHTITTSAGHFGQVTVLATDWETLKKNGIDKETAEKCTWVSQFIMEYYGCGTGQALTDPMHTIVTKDRFALITVMGTQYCILDICLRMLSPEELKLAQGFPKDYVINRDYAWKKYPKYEQVARIGNSVVPVMARALIEANCGYLKVGERRPIPIMQYPAVGQIAFA